MQPLPASQHCSRQRPYFVEYARSHLNPEAKRRKARSVLGWGTAWEALRVLLAFFLAWVAAKFRTLQYSTLIEPQQIKKNVKFFPISKLTPCGASLEVRKHAILQGALSWMRKHKEFLKSVQYIVQTDFFTLGPEFRTNPPEKTFVKTFSKVFVSKCFIF